MAAKPWPWIDEALIEKLAGSAAFERGRSYWREQRVTLLSADERGLEATVRGTRRYRLWLRSEADDRLDWYCDCPAAEDGAFCKHLVAAALIQCPSEAAAQPPRAALREKLHEALGKQPEQGLAEAAQRNPQSGQRMRLGQPPPEELKRALSRGLTARGLLDYHGSNAYAAQLEAPLGLLEELLDADPEQCVALCEYALKRLFKVYQRADDSSGGVGGCIAEFARLHASAVAKAGGSGAKLATSLYKLKLLDDWGMFPLSSYWQSLGPSGRTAYARRVEQEYQVLPSAPDRGRSDEFSVLHRREELARAQGDLDALIALYARDLSTGYSYQKIICAYRENGREEKALAWAERGVEAHPDWRGMHALLAEEYHHAGRAEEALEMAWQAYRRELTLDAWDGLKRIAGAHWPASRERALEEAAQREITLDDGRREVGERVRLLQHDGDLAAAIALARDNGVQAHRLLQFAEAVIQDYPRDAAAFLRRVVDQQLQEANSGRYPSIVRLMQRAKRCDPAAHTETWLQTLRQRYARRPALMKQMDKARL